MKFPGGRTRASPKTQVHSQAQQRLKTYSGDLAALVRLHPSDEVLRATDIDGVPTARLYIFDGLDEVPADRFSDFVRKFNELARSEPDSRILLTSRQAFFVGR